MARRPLPTAIATLIVSVTLLLSGCADEDRSGVVRMEDRLETLLELHTYEYIYRDLVYFGEERSFLFIKTVDRAVLFAVDIRVRAGVDLAEGVVLTADRAASDRIYVRLPRTRILSVDADESSIQEYFLREQGGRIGLLELTGQIDEAKDRVAAEAVERGILDQADANARRVVRGFLTLAGFNEVVFAPVGEGPGDEGEQTDEEFRG